MKCFPKCLFITLGEIKHFRESEYKYVTAPFIHFKTNCFQGTVQLVGKSLLKPMKALQNSSDAWLVWAPMGDSNRLCFTGSQV